MNHRLHNTVTRTCRRSFCTRQTQRAPRTETLQRTPESNVGGKKIIRRENKRLEVLKGLLNQSTISHETPEPLAKPVSYLKIPKQDLDRINLEEKIGFIRGFRCKIFGQYMKRKPTGSLKFGHGTCADSQQKTKIGRYHHKGHLECIHASRGKVGVQIHLDYDIDRVVNTPFAQYPEEERVHCFQRRKNPRPFPIKQPMGSPAWHEKFNAPFSERNHS